jgi:acetolactate synthase-1/2/3 large subunit
MAAIASIRNTQRNYFQERYLGTDPGSGLMLPDLENLASTYDLPFLRITDAGDSRCGPGASPAAPRPSA